MKPNLNSPEKVVLTVATTGGLHGKEANSALPEQPDEIIADFEAAYRAGASIAHIHVRERDGRTSADPAIYSEVLTGIRERCPGMITQVGNGIGIARDDKGVPLTFTQEQRMALCNIEPRPDMLTVNAGTFHFDHKGTEWLFDNSKTWNTDFIGQCRQRDIVNELEVYDLSHIENMLELQAKGVLTQPMHFSFVMGIKGGIPATPQNLLVMLDSIPEGSSWQLITIGRAQVPLTTVAVAMGGNLRVGFEDNVYYRKGELAKNNAQLVERAVRIVKELGREVASVEEARAKLGIRTSEPELAAVREN